MNKHLLFKDKPLVGRDDSRFVFSKGVLCIAYLRNLVEDATWVRCLKLERGPRVSTIKGGVIEELPLLVGSLCDVIDNLEWRTSCGDLIRS